jgi:hypothetical protein
MNYSEISTTPELIKAFRLCENSGEQIELFEQLASQDNPPTDIFVQVLREIQLEPVLVLSIKAFGIITNEDIKEKLKESDDLLSMLCEKAKSGASDLIRWTAAVTIDIIGFDFLSISQYLTEEPSKIAEKIVASKRKIISSFYNHSGVITERNDYQEVVDFWVYGPINEFRSITKEGQSHTLSVLVTSVVENQGFYGLKVINNLLELHTEQYADRSGIYDNYLYENAIISLSMRLMKASKYKNDSSIFLINQSHFLESDNSEIRIKAASSIIANRHKLSGLKSSGIKLRGIHFSTIAQAILDCDFDVDKNFSYEKIVYEDLVEKRDNLYNAIELVSRNQVKNYLKTYAGKISRDLNILSPGLSWHQMLIIKEKERQVEEENQRLEKEIEEGRIAKFKADKEARKKLISNSIKLALVSPIILFDLFCIVAYLTNKISHDQQPLSVLLIGAILGPFIWLALLLLTAISVVCTLVNHYDMSLFNPNTQQCLGMILVALIGSLPTWGSPIWLEFLGDYLHKRRSKK